jgi:hypothetical protein
VVLVSEESNLGDKLTLSQVTIEAHDQIRHGLRSTGNTEFPPWHSSSTFIR